MVRWLRDILAMGDDGKLGKNPRGATRQSYQVFSPALPPILQPITSLRQVPDRESKPHGDAKANRTLLGLEKWAARENHRVQMRSFVNEVDERREVGESGRGSCNK